MSCNCTNQVVNICGDSKPPVVVSAGIKGSELPQLTSASPNDSFFVIDYSAQKTKKISFYDLLQSLSVGSNIVDVGSSGTYIREYGNWVSFDPDSKLDTSAFYPISAIDHTQIINIGINSHQQIDNHISATNNPHNLTKTQIGLSAVDNTSDVDKPISNAVYGALNNKFDVSAINQYTTTATFNSHTSDNIIHIIDVSDGDTYLRTSGTWVKYTPPTILTGETSARPASPTNGLIYLDTTLGYPIWYISPNWVNATGATV